MMKDQEKKEQTFENEDSRDELSDYIMEEIEIEDLTVDGICGVY